VPVPRKPNGPEKKRWSDRVTFTRKGFAYRPGEVIVPEKEKGKAKTKADKKGRLKGKNFDDLPGGRFSRVAGAWDASHAIAELRAAGIDARPNAVLFADADSGCGCGGCPPHPAQEGAEEFYEANPFYANAFYANPFYANPFYANPFYANPDGGCCCGASGSTADPFYANPFYANPHDSPIMNPNGARTSTATPAPAPFPGGTKAPKDEDLPTGTIKWIAVLDTGMVRKNGQKPTFPGGGTISGDFVDEPDAGDPDLLLDPVAGHGTFIAGIICKVVTDWDIHVVDMVGPYGDVDETTIASWLDHLKNPLDANGNAIGGYKPPALVNLSLSGYSPFGMPDLAAAVAALQEEGTVIVASAGNDATCLPPYPAALPGVVSVGATSENDSEKAATFTNYGPWVRACAEGEKVTSTFFVADLGMGLNYQGGAQWSGTSFAAPRVVAELAKEANSLAAGAAIDYRHVADAVDSIIDDEGLKTIPMLGTIVPEPP